VNLQAIRILFLKDLFLSRRQLSGYFVAGLAASAVACLPDATASFVGFILVITVAIASGIHLIGTLMLAETTDQTRLLNLRSEQGSRVDPRLTFRSQSEVNVFWGVTLS